MEVGDYCVKIIEVAGMRTATIQQVESIEEDVIRLVDCSLLYRADTYNEINPIIPGCNSYLVEFDDGEVDNWGLSES